MPISKEVEKEIIKSKKKGEFIYPFYEKYCFSNIPSTIMKLFGIKSKRPVLPSKLYKDKIGIKDSEKIILLLIDGFGYTQWLKYFRKYKFLDNFTKNGQVSPITTIFPSTTAAAITTINSGLTPQEHALPEWVVYFKEIDMIINTLPFTPLNNKILDRLLDLGVDSKILFNGKNIYQILKEKGIKSFSFISKSYVNSAYSNLVYKGSKRISIENISDLTTKLRNILKKEKGPAYFYVYVGDLDTISHKYGPHTKKYHKELSSISISFQKEFLEKMNRNSLKGITMIITGDHGHIKIEPKKTIYLNKYRNITDNLQKSKKGKLIQPTGSPRDVFLHVEPEKLEITKEFLSNKLKGKAKVIKTKDAVNANLFGIGKSNKKFYDRIGNLLILPYKNKTIWYKHSKDEKFDLLGFHGGLNKEEMLVPFAIAKLSDLD